MPQNQFVTAFVDAVCDNIGPCCAASGYAYDATKCKTLAGAQYTSLFKSNENVVYNPGNAADCIEAVKQAAAGCGSLDLDGGAACSGVYEGLLPEGAECKSSIECAAPAGGNASCDSEAGGPGHCVIEKRGEEGDTCYATCTQSGSSTGCGSSGGDPTSATCYTNDGLYCSSSYVCKKLSAIGTPCEGDGCVEGAYCNAGMCEALPSSGEACGAGFHCAEELYCAADSTCTPKLAKGQPCTDLDQCANGYCEANVCKTPSLASPSACNGASNSN